MNQQLSGKPGAVHPKKTGMREAAIAAVIVALTASLQAVAAGYLWGVEYFTMQLSLLMTIWPTVMAGYFYAFGLKVRNQPTDSVSEDVKTSEEWSPDMVKNAPPIDYDRHAG